MTKRLVVIGGTAAGLSAASKAKRIDPELEIEVYERTGYISYGACGLPYFVGGMIEEPEDLVSFTVDQMREKRGINVFTHCEAVRIDREKKCVSINNLDTGESFSRDYDRLVIATGAHPIKPDIKGADAEGVYYLRTVEDGIRLKYTVNQAAVKRAVVVGGGFIGLEMAEELTEAGLKVTVIEAYDRLMPVLPEDYSHMVEEKLKENGVELILGEPVKEIVSEDGKVKGIKTEHTETDCGLVLMCIGVRPSSELAEHCGLRLGVKGSIAVDDYMQTSDPCIFACGDCAETKHMLTKTPAYIPLGTTANKQGKIAGENLFEKRAVFGGVLGSTVTKCFDLYLAVTGFSREQALSEGCDVETVSIVKGDRASYYPGGRDVHLSLVFEKAGGRLLGAQAVGGESIAGRINTLAVAVQNKMTVFELAESDLVYAPPVAPVYDPILIAASQAEKKACRR